MQEFYIERDYDLDLKFIGEIIADTAAITIYKTESGQYVCETLIDKVHSAFVCKNMDDVIINLGYSRESKEIYRCANIQHWIEL